MLHNLIRYGAIAFSERDYSQQINSISHHGRVHFPPIDRYNNKHRYIYLPVAFAMDGHCIKDTYNAQKTSIDWSYTE